MDRAWDFCGALRSIGRAVRGVVERSRRGGEDLARPVAQEGGDTIFAIDRHVEPVIEAGIESWPEWVKPVELIAEGMGPDGRRMFGRGGPRYHVIVDPIDGTRNVMYDKRSAWFLAAVVPGGGTLKDSLASVMVELPTSKARYADEYAAQRDGPERGVRAVRVDLMDGREEALRVGPSSAGTLRHGFGQVVSFFPGTKVEAAGLMEAIATSTLGPVRAGEGLIFDDQYLTTGGQLVELMMGRDRFTADLRPRLFALSGKAMGLACHPYDMAGWLVAHRAGVIITDGYGQPFDAPLDVHTGLNWVGYGNAGLRETIEPVMMRWLGEREARGYGIDDR